MDRLNRGKDLHAEGRFDEAIEEPGLALAVNGGLAEACFYRGLAYYRKGDPDRAIADREAALRIEPNHTGARNNLEKARRERER
ncbi:MAG: tetratricopeptide repeat protein [Treponema sp.]|nr:tetratricopeptide repeat protein [Treponema sp.]